MGKGSSYGSPTRWLAGLALIAAMWLVAFEHDDRIPGLAYVNLGLHELGHMLTYANSDLVNALAGSIAQVAIPLAVALWLLFRICSMLLFLDSSAPVKMEMELRENSSPHWSASWEELETLYTFDAASWSARDPKGSPETKGTDNMPPVSGGARVAFQSVMVPST